MWIGQFLTTIQKVPHILTKESLESLIYICLVCVPDALQNLSASIFNTSHSKLFPNIGTQLLMQTAVPWDFGLYFLLP